MQKQRIKTHVVDRWRIFACAQPKRVAERPIVRPKFSISLIWNKLTQEASKSFCPNSRARLSSGNDS